jgi:Flp pilus assembly pilin Flp
MAVGLRTLAWWHSLPGNDRGASLVEYAFLAMLIAIAALAALQFLGTQVNADIEDFNSEYGNARGGPPPP